MAIGQMNIDYKPKTKRTENTKTGEKLFYFSMSENPTKQSVPHSSGLPTI